MSQSKVDQNLAHEQQQENAREERVAKFGFDLLDINLWKNYTCHKKVLAVPLKRGLYNLHQGWPMPEKENPEDEGYLIEYLDGGKGNHPKHENYISWSPKDVFERSYVQQPSPFTATGHVEEDVPMDENGFASFILKNPIKAKAMTLGQFSEIYYSPNPLADVNTEGFAVQVSTADGGFAIEFLTEGEFASQFKLQGAVGFFVNVDETPFIKPMSISKMEPLENGMALGTVEQLSNVNGQLDFSDALRALKFGYRVQRSGWNGKDMWLSVSNLNTATVPADKFWSPHNSQYATENGGSAEVPPCITMKNAKGQIQMGWAPSPEDMFCSDWFVFEKQYEFSGTADTDAHLKGIETKDQSCDQELRHQFDFDRSDFTKVYARLANFLNDNGNEREKLEVHQHGLLEVQLNIMTLLENLINCHGGDIGENGEVMTCLTLPEALMFVDAGFTVRHKTWIPGDSISKVSREGGSAIYRVGVDLPWEIPSVEVFRKNWVLLYKEV